MPAFSAIRTEAVGRPLAIFPLPNRKWQVCLPNSETSTYWLKVELQLQVLNYMCKKRLYFTYFLPILIFHCIYVFDNNICPSFLTGTKYMYLSSTDKVIRAKKGTSGVHIFKTKQALIISVYEDPVVPEQCATVTEKLGEYLISVQF